MIIKLLEQPIVAIHEAEITGTVDGVIIKGSKVNCIYHGNMEDHFVIPIERAIIGSDAVMIPDVSVMAMASKNVRPLRSMINVYNLKGKRLGYLQGIEVDEQFIARYIYTEECRIEMSKAVSYDRVFIVDAEEADLEAIEEQDTLVDTENEEAVVAGDSGENPAEGTEAVVSMEIGPEIEWEAEDYKPEEKSAESSELSLVKPVHHEEDKKEIPYVEAKYAYLCGKQLLEGIEIDDTLYKKGTIIDAELIKHAISSNAIVKVIVNAEE
ncbi:MAG TPA: hypothetical protein PLG67_11725 [Bacillota bacterium]|nr:hypothetical protein [Bacillota bacterium]